MKPKGSLEPLSPRYSAATPSRPGQPDIKLRKDDKQRSWTPDRELYSFFVIRPSYDPEATEERDDKSVQFMFVGRPDIDEGDTQGRHIHAYALYKEAIYSVLEERDILEVPEALHKFLKHHKHYYNTEDARKRSYDERVSWFIHQTIDDDSMSPHAYRSGIAETTTREQRAQAEQLDKDMFAYFEERCRGILSARGVADIDMEALFQLEGLTVDEQKAVSIYTSFCERQNYLTARDIRANMKDAEYIKICSRTNELVSEAIEIVNAMPGITFQYGSSKGSGEKDGMRWLREENAKPAAEQNHQMIALNMRRLIDFPVGFFGEKADYDLKEVLANHVALVHTAFPNIQINEAVLTEFVRAFKEHEPFVKTEADGSKTTTTWDDHKEPLQLLEDLMKGVLFVSTPNSSTSTPKGAALAGPTSVKGAKK